MWASTTPTRHTCFKRRDRRLERIEESADRRQESGEKRGVQREKRRENVKNHNWITITMCGQTGATMTIIFETTFEGLWLAKDFQASQV